MQAACFRPLTNRSASSAATVEAGGFALPEDGFYQIVPLGSAPNRLGEKSVLQFVDVESLEAMRDDLVNRGGEMLVDQDHLSHDSENSTDALAWIVCDDEALEIREDGLYNRLRLTTVGESKLTGGVMRYISPEFDPASVTWISDKTLKPRRLVGAGMTNRPGFRMAKPLTNRAAEGGADNAKTIMQNKMLARLLGITEEALSAMDEAGLTAAVEAFEARAAESTKQVESMMNREIDGILEDHAAVLPVSNAPLRAMVRQALLANREQGELVLAGLVSAAASADPAKSRADYKPLHNRQGSVTPPAQVSADDVDNKLHNRAVAIRNQTGCTYERALMQARTEPAA